ncbi:MAG: EMC3/TMCO1 family protein [Candidatus Micrarchaeia archaeon]
MIDSALAPYFIISFAILYSLISSLITFRFGGRKRLKEIQEEINQLKKEMEEAIKSNDKLRRKKAEKKQHEQLPRLTSEMMKISMTSMLLIVPFFFAFLWVMNSMVPGSSDDIRLIPTNSSACAGVDVACATYQLKDTDTEGLWVALAKSPESENATTFYVGNTSTLMPEPRYNEHGNLIIKADKNLYSKGENITILVQGNNTNNTQIFLDRGTRFYFVLPFSIPFAGNTLDASGLFISCVLITSIILSQVMQKFI